MHDDITFIADGTQRVVLQRPGSDFEAEIQRALFRTYRHQRSFAVAESIVPKLFAHCYFATDSIDGEPNPGDEIVTENGTRWMIVEVNRSELNGNWQAVMKTYDVVFGLDEFVDHLKTAYEKTASGVLRRGFRVAKTGVPAKFSKTSIELGDDRKASLFVLIRERLEFECFDTIRRADGTIFEIEKINYPLFPNDWTEILCTSKS